VIQRQFGVWVLMFAVALTGCDIRRPDPLPSLVGAWRSTVEFTSGPFAAVKDLEFMYVFNAGGTMTESSNYDGAPPVPPAYGVWHSVGENQFEARYEYFATAAPPNLDELSNGGGWLPAGRGVLVERITIAPDKQSYTSTIHYDAFDLRGKPVEGGGEAGGRAVRIGM